MVVTTGTGERFQPEVGLTPTVGFKTRPLDPGGWAAPDGQRLPPPCGRGQGSLPDGRRHSSEPGIKDKHRSRAGIHP